jgi:ectoine hydroxylase-related dioxygenase (phytanoyl-CoA dioxygenase family)
LAVERATRVDAALREEYRRDGVACLRGLLGPRDLANALAAYEWSLAHPSPSANTYQGGDGRFYQDLANRAAQPVYRELVHTTPAADACAALWGAPDVWFMYEQVFLKEGGDTRRTPWHQDSSYLPVDGDQIAVVWICFDAIPAAHSLEFVRGSHRGPMYDGSAFDPKDDTAPIYGDGSLPRLPDIEADRRRASEEASGASPLRAQRANGERSPTGWDITSFAVAPGDAVFFHPGVLHGGAATRRDMRRRTLSLRFFGADAHYAKRPFLTDKQIPEAKATSVFQLLSGRLKPGDAFRHPEFPKVRPQREA